MSPHKQHTTNNQLNAGKNEVDGRRKKLFSFWFQLNQVVVRVICPIKQVLLFIPYKIKINQFVIGRMIGR